MPSDSKRATAKIYGSKCFVCLKPFGKGFAFHHLWYLPNEKIYKDFKTGAEYEKHVIKEILNNPKRFILLCKKHHSAVEIMKRYKPETMERLYSAVTMSRY